MPAAPSRPSARELLGGRWAISVRTWLIFSAATAAMPVFGIGLLDHGSLPGIGQITILQWVLIIHVATWILLSVIFLCAHLTVFRNRRSVPVAIGWVIGLPLLVSVARSALVYALVRLQPDPSLSFIDLLTIFVYPLSSIIIVWLLITYLVASNGWYASERERLMRFELDAAGARLRALGALDATRAVITSRIRRDLESQLAVLDDSVRSDQVQPSDVLLEAASAYVRPESHELWPTPTATNRRGVLGEIERASLATPLPLRVPYALCIGIIAPVALAQTGFGPAFADVFILLIGTLALFPIGRRAIRRWAPAPHTTRARLLSLATIVLALVPLGLYLIVPHAPHVVAPIVRWLVTVAIFAVIVVAVGWLQAIQRLRSERLRDLRSEAEEIEFQRRAFEAATDQMQRDLAIYLHGTVQAGLVASAYAIQEAAARGDTIALEHAIDEARAAAARVDGPAPALVERDLPTVRAAIDETWQGVLAIRWTVPDGELSATVVDQLGKVARECLANASIHGAATEATVRIAVEDDCVIIEVTDNGTGLGDGTPGLGSAVLNEATASQWTITTVPTGGAQVRAVVPV